MLAFQIVHEIAVNVVVLKELVAGIVVVLKDPVAEIVVVRMGPDVGIEVDQWDLVVGIVAGLMVPGEIGILVFLRDHVVVQTVLDGIGIEVVRKES